MTRKTRNCGVWNSTVAPGKLLRRRRAAWRVLGYQNAGIRRFDVGGGRIEVPLDVVQAHALERGTLVLAGRAERFVPQKHLFDGIPQARVAVGLAAHP